MKTKIVIVEDNPISSKLIRYQLELENYEVFIEADGANGLKTIKNQKPELIILDVGLPDINGFELCKNLKSFEKTKDLPIILLTARAEDCDRIEGLKLGADDYITKPYNIEELALRIKNLLRRTEKNKILDSNVKFEDLDINFNKREVKIKNKLIKLTFSEYQILSFFVCNREEVFKKKDLNKIIFNISEEAESRTIDTHVHNLRKKLKIAGKYINTIRNVGYIFTVK
jgi:DNA-binding response OmpR family regulator